MSKLSIVDEPLAGGAQDGLKTDIYRRGLCRFIECADTPITVALQGEWGSGKTSLMNALRNELCDDAGKRFFPVWINTWHHSLMSNAEMSVLSILEEIIECLVGDMLKDGGETWRRFIGFTKRIGKVIAVNAGNVAGGLIGSNRLGSDTYEMMGGAKPSGGQSEVGVAKLKEAIAERIAALLKEKRKDGVIFFIDDLDRIDPQVAVQILELLKNIFDIKNCVFVLAIDYDVVVKGLKSKFGEMTAANEREFRSFFDKIIQLPFTMPVNAYQIDDFLIGNLSAINFITESERGDAALKRTITEFAQLSVGRNPRSLKRLMNTLSLIQIMGEMRAEGTDGDDKSADEKTLEKKLNFAMVCLQVSYPAVYNLLVREPDFKAKWNDAFAAMLELPELTPLEKERFKSDENFDEPWEQLLYRVCQKNTFLKQHALDISRLLNKVAGLVAEASGGTDAADADVGEYVRQSIALSAVTNVTTSEEAAAVKIEDFDCGFYVREVCRKAIERIANAAIAEKFGENTYFCNRGQRIVKTGRYCFWEGDNFERSTPYFEITAGHDNRNYYVELSGWFPVFLGFESVDEGEAAIQSQGLKARIFAELEVCAQRHGGKCEFGQECGECGLCSASARIHYKTLDDIVSDEGMERYAEFLVEYISVYIGLDGIRGKDSQNPYRSRDALCRYLQGNNLIAPFDDCPIPEPDSKSVALCGWRIERDELAIEVTFRDDEEAADVSFYSTAGDSKKKKDHVRALRDRFNLEFEDSDDGWTQHCGIPNAQIIKFMERNLRRLPR